MCPNTWDLTPDRIMFTLFDRFEQQLPCHRQANV